MPELLFDGHVIEYEVIRKKKKSLSIIVKEDGRIIVTVPYYVDDGTVSQFVNSKARWIFEKKSAIVEEMKNRTDLHEGKKLFYMGRPYSLKYLEDDVAKMVQIKLLNDKIIAEYNPLISNENKVSVLREGLTEWYVKQAKYYLTLRTIELSKKYNLFPNIIRIKDQKTRWGSCSIYRNINYNWRIIMAPEEIMNYVVVHELCHLKYLNHSQDFWGEVKKILPNYVGCQKWLREYGRKLVI